MIRKIQTVNETKSRKVITSFTRSVSNRLNWFTYIGSLVRVVDAKLGNDELRLPKLEE